MMPERQGDNSETQRTGPEGLSIDEDCRRILVRARGELGAAIAAAELSGGFPRDFTMYDVREEILLDLRLRGHHREVMGLEKFRSPDKFAHDSDPDMAAARALDEYLNQRIDHYQARIDPGEAASG
jgi:hypothetical protein